MRLVDCYSQFSFRGSVRIFQILNLVFKLHYRAIKLFSSLFVISTDREVKQSPSSLFALLARSWIALKIRHCNREVRAVVEIAMEKYRLMLPYTRNVDDRNEMKNYYAIVYDNWSVQLGSGEHGVGMPDVCEILFRDNVLPQFINGCTDHVA